MRYKTSLEQWQQSELLQLPYSALQRDIRPSPERRLRIALFSGNYNCVCDGSSQALNRLVSFLITKTGARVRIYSPTVPRPAFTPAGDLVSVPSIGIPGRSEYRFALGLPAKLRTDIEQFDPDIVHLSTPDVLGRRAQHFARARGIPIVTSLHTRFETYLEYYGLRILEGWITRYLRRFYGDSDRILVPNELIAEEMRAAGIERPLAIWGRGVDRTIFTPDRRDPAWRRALGYGDDDVIVLFFGRLVREKGLDMFCQVMETARAMGHHLRPLIVGDGPAKDAFASRLPDANFLGHLSGADLGRAVASADILLNPSVTEAFGNVTLEAMAAGVAILSADVPSAQALVQHGRTGILVRADRSESYARGLDQLIRRPEFRMSLIQAALVEASRYEWNDILSDVVSVYRDCLRSRLARPSA